METHSSKYKSKIIFLCTFLKKKERNNFYTHENPTFKLQEYNKHVKEDDKKAFFCNSVFW